MDFGRASVSDPILAKMTVGLVFIIVAALCYRLLVFLDAFMVSFAKCPHGIRSGSRFRCPDCKQEAYTCAGLTRSEEANFVAVNARRKSPETIFQDAKKVQTSEVARLKNAVTFADNNLVARQTNAGHVTFESIGYRAICLDCGEPVAMQLNSLDAVRCINGHLVVPTIALRDILSEKLPLQHAVGKARLTTVAS